MNVAQVHFVKPSVWLRGNAARMVCQLPRLVYPSQHLGGTAA